MNVEKSIVHPVTKYLICKKCGYPFAASTIEYMAGKAKCPQCNPFLNQDYMELPDDWDDW